MSYLNAIEKKEANEAMKVLEELEKIQKDPNINEIFFKKYKVIKKIAEGSFGSIYEGINIMTNIHIAIKLEDRSQNNFLEKEAYNLFTLKGFGIVELISFGRNKKYNIMIQPLLGDSLYKIFLNLKKNFTLKDICLIGLQCLDRIEYIHSKNIIHCDIKPENFLMGIKDPLLIYIIDFGLSKKYRSKRTMKHIQFTLTKKLTGTARYASVNALKGFELSRRDDLESFCYMILFFILKKLPWQGVKAQTQAKRFKKICEMKELFNIGEYKNNIPLEIINIFKYVKKLKFEEEPNYSKIKNLFIQYLIKNNYSENDTFSWINDRKTLSLKKYYDKNKRKSNLKVRIMNSLINKNKYKIINDLNCSNSPPSINNYYINKMYCPNSERAYFDKNFIKNKIDQNKNIIFDYYSFNKKNKININDLTNTSRNACLRKDLYISKDKDNYEVENGKIIKIKNASSNIPIKKNNFIYNSKKSLLKVYENLKINKKNNSNINKKNNNFSNNSKTKYLTTSNIIANNETNDRSVTLKNINKKNSSNNIKIKKSIQKIKQSQIAKMYSQINITNKIDSLKKMCFFNPITNNKNNINYNNTLCNNNINYKRIFNYNIK